MCKSVNNNFLQSIMQHQQKIANHFFHLALLVFGLFAVDNQSSNYSRLLSFRSNFLW